MGKLSGFRSSEKDSLVKRAAAALIWLRGRKDGESEFISWRELYAGLRGMPVDRADPVDVKDRLRTKAYYVKAFLRESGYGWATHEADRSLIRATAPGDDSARNCVPYYQRRLARASENFVNWTDKTVGDISEIQRTKANASALASLTHALPKARALMNTIGMVIDLPARSERSGPKHARVAEKKAA